MTIELLERPAEASAAPAATIPISQQIWEEKYRFAPVIRKPPSRRAGRAWR